MHTQKKNLKIQNKKKQNFFSLKKMAGFPYSHEFYNSFENQYNPYEFTSNSYANFSENYCTNAEPSFYNCSENNYNPYEFTPNSYGNFYENNFENDFSMPNEQN